MKSRMGSHKSEQREKERQQRARSKSGKEKKLSQKEQEDLDEIVQKIAEQQVTILELVMRLLNEDKKKYDEHLEKSVAQHQKLWKQYN